MRCSTDPLITPRSGAGICPRCWNFTRSRTGLCRACELNGDHLAAVAPRSWAPAGGTLHGLLADYKRAAEPALPALMEEFTEVLSSFLAHHEACIADAARVSGFDVVVAVPSGNPARDRRHPLRRILAERVPSVAARVDPELLVNSGTVCPAHRYDERRFLATRRLDGERLLLVDDTWTTGASAQAAAAVLLRAGASRVAIAVVGRFVNPYWGGIAQRLADLASEPPPAGCVFGCRPPVTASYTPDSPKGGRSSVG